MSRMAEIHAELTDVMDRGNYKTVTEITNEELMEMGANLNLDPDFLAELLMDTFGTDSFYAGDGLFESER